MSLHFILIFCFLFLSCSHTKKDIHQIVNWLNWNCVWFSMFTADLSSIISHICMWCIHLYSVLMPPVSTVKANICNKGRTWLISRLIHYFIHGSQTTQAAIEQLSKKKKIRFHDSARRMDFQWFNGVCTNLCKSLFVACIYSIFGARLTKPTFGACK